MVLVETVDIAKIIKIGSLHASRKLSFCDLFYQIFKVHDESYNIEPQECFACNLTIF